MPNYGNFDPKNPQEVWGIIIIVAIYATVFYFGWKYI